MPSRKVPPQPVDIHSSIKLDGSKQETRLVVIEPGQHADPIQCAMESASLNDGRIMEPCLMHGAKYLGGGPSL
jgi:hypothetical protein